MKIVVVDGQGGGIGRMLVEKLKAALPHCRIVAVGTNALATSAMLRAGADAGATGENAVRYNCQGADLLLGPSGIGIENAMLGEISPAMAQAVNESPTHKCLLPMDGMGPFAPKPRAASMEAAANAIIEEAVTYVNQHE